MAGRLRMIAVCLSEAHSFLNTGFLNELGRAAAEKGYGVAVFNSSLDLRWYQKDNPAPRSVYKAIHFDLFDALCIINHSFHDEEMIRELVKGAQIHHVPVILCGSEMPGCWILSASGRRKFLSLKGANGILSARMWRIS